MADVQRSPGQTGTDGRICPQCQAENPTSAEFCWKCFARFGVHPGPMPGRAVPGAMRPGAAGSGTVPPPPAPPAGGQWPAQAPGQAPGSRGSGSAYPGAGYPQSTANRRRPSVGKILVGAFVGLLVLGLVRGGFSAVFGPHVHFPESMAGVSRNHDATAQDFEQRIQDEAGHQHVTLEGAMYGPGTPATFAVIAGSHSAETPQTTFEDFASGLSEGSGSQAAVDLGSTQTDEADGTTYICARVTGVAPGGLCMWADDGSTGFVETFDRNAKATRALIGQVRTAVLS